MKSVHLAAATLLVVLSVRVDAATDPVPPGSCMVHAYPADGVHSVGEDFDAVHRVDQDLRHYYEVAGRSLDWLTPDRQAVLLRDMPLSELAGVTATATTVHPEPLSRRQALEPRARESGDGCLIEIMLPQIMLERGGLAARSLRIFGVIRRYDNGALVRGFSGYAAAQMTGFELRSPADADKATAIVEDAYRAAVQSLLRNAAKPPRK